MARQSGSTIGIYQVLSPLGAGGMGEVYRARDTKLNRDVALKVLPEAFAADPQRMARFEREAQVLASLNHPNIAAIYGLEESGSTRALVMELVEGETLAERIGTAKAAPSTRSGSVGAIHELSLQETLQIARQVAEALEYAHDRGVVHRDLKPANIKITPEGTVKVLDFGLAKAMGPEDISRDTSNSPTLSLAMTQAGFIVGTAAYMSPEQAKAKPIERRADIWAFGVVLFEMLSGKKLFEGETVSDILAAVIRAEPDWNMLPEETPPAIRRLVRRCLEKDPRQRLQAIGEARITIEESLAGGAKPIETQATASGVAPLPPQPAEAIPPRRSRMPWIATAASLMVAAVFAVAYFIKSPPPAGAIRSLIAVPDKVNFAFDGTEGGPVLSPDGTRLVFPGIDSSGKEALWLRPLDSLDAQRLQGTEGATFPFWSPGSRYLGFFQDGKLKKIDVTGGPPVLICDAADARGGAWSMNGTIVFAPAILAGGLESVPAAGGTPSRVAAPKGTGAAFSNRWPEFLPDGKHFIYLSGDLSAAGTQKLGIRIGEVGTNEEKFLIQADSEAIYTAPGYLLFLRGDTLMAQRFDAGSRKLEGEVFPVAEHIASPQLFRLGYFSVSQTGLLIYSAAGASTSGGQLVWVDGNGKEIGKIGPAGTLGPVLSPDGKQVAYNLLSPGAPGPDLWLIDIKRGVQTRFTFGPSDNVTPVWSPDGSRIAYSSLRQSQYNIYVKDASGAGSATPLLESDPEKFPTDWSHDGRYIAFERMDPKGKTKFDIWILPTSGDHKPFAYLQTPFNEGGAMFSPDGHWMAYESDQSGSFEIYLSPFPAGGSKWQVSQGGGVQALWSRDGNKLYYIAPGGKLMEAAIKENGSAVQIGTPQELFQEQFQDSTSSGQSYAVAPDGKRFLVDKALQGASPPLTLVANWTAGIQK